MGDRKQDGVEQQYPGFFPPYLPQTTPKKSSKYRFFGYRATLAGKQVRLKQASPDLGGWDNPVI